MAWLADEVRYETPEEVSAGYRADFSAVEALYKAGDWAGALALKTEQDGGNERLALALMAGVNMTEERCAARR